MRGRRWRRAISTHAAQQVAALRQSDPRGLQTLLLTIELELQRDGAAQALGAYESWMHGGATEEPLALRSIAWAMLLEVARGNPAPDARVKALAELAAAGDSAARGMLSRAVATGPLGEARAAAAQGNPEAVARLGKELMGPVGDKIALVDALAKSARPEAIPPLVTMLDDPRPEHEAAAAQALASLKATDQIPKIRALLNRPGLTITVRMAAAAALFRLNDLSGYDQLQKWLESPVADVRLSAVQALATSPTDCSWVPAARALTADPDPMMRLGAAQALAPEDPELSRTTLDQLLADPNQAIRELAGRQAGETTSDWGQLRALLRSGDAMTRVEAASRIVDLTR